MKVLMKFGSLILSRAHQACLELDVSDKQTTQIDIKLSELQEVSMCKGLMLSPLLICLTARTESILLTHLSDK
jgi:hypothetical protein